MAKLGGKQVYVSCNMHEKGKQVLGRHQQFFTFSHFH